MTHEEIDYEAREAMQALRGKLSARATSSEFNEWMAREICEYIDRLLQAQRWRPIDDEAKDGQPRLIWCRHCAGEQQAVCWWQGNIGWQGGPAEVPKFEAIAYMPLPEPPSSFEEPTTEATPSAQPAEGDHDTNPSHDG